MTNERELNDLSKEELIAMVMHLQTDVLTGCYKREVLSTVHKKNYVVGMVDINNLKIVNDTQGHDKGDEYILSVANSIRNAIRKKDIVVRYGGDEFVIIFSCCINTARKILKRISNASCGVAEHECLNTAIKLADEDMYTNKKRYHEAIS